MRDIVRGTARVLCATALLLMGGVAHAEIVNVGALSYDTLIPAGGGSPGVNAFNLANLTGAFSLPPDFPVSDAVTFGSATLTLTLSDLSQNVFSLGDIGPGFLLDQSGNPLVQVSGNQVFDSAEFRATISPLTFGLSDGSEFTASSGSIDVQLLPSSGSALTVDVDQTTIGVSQAPQSGAPEPPGAALVLLPLLLGLAWRFQRNRRSGLAVLGLLLILRAQEARSQTPVAVTLTPATSPASGEPGVTSISVTGSNFPAGTIAPASVTVSLNPGAGAAVTTPATAVTTVTGTTRRVTFTIPATVSVASPTNYAVTIGGSTSAGTSFASSNAASLTVNPAASIQSVAPASGAPGQTLPVTITGQFSNFVQGATQASFGAAITVSSLTVTSATQATANIAIAAAAATGPRTVTMTTGLEVATLGNGFTVATAGGAPTITDFTPKSGPGGTLISLSGTNLASATVALAALGGGTIGAPVASASATSVSFVIPAGAATGPVTVSSGSASVSSTATLTVTPASNFTLSASPASAGIVTGQTASYSIQLSSANGFSQLAQLSLAGLPAGVTASFKPTSITAGQISVLTLTAPANQPTGSSSLSITASATVNGLPVTQTAVAQLTVKPPSTSVLGRTVVADALETPLAGVSVSMLGRDGNGNTTGCTGSTVSDSAGNFALSNLPALCTGPQLVGFNGLTATSPAGSYAGVNLVFTLVSGQVTASPVLVHLPRIDNQETFSVQQNSATTQSYSFGSIPGLKVVVYPGTTFTMPDGSVPNPFPLTAVQVPVDRLPDLKPNVPTMIRAFIVAFQPANVNTNEPVAVYFPNSLNTAPGTNMVLMTLDPTHGTMVPYGSGAVSFDGTQIVPDADPAHPGHLYGLIHFDWHGPMPPPPPDFPQPCGIGCQDQNAPGPPILPPPGDPTPPPGDTPPCGDPVDPLTGLEVFTSTDIGIFGPRGSIYMLRSYRTLMTAVGPFGIGTQHNYGYLLDTGNPLGAGVINMIMPDNTRIPFTLQGNGTFVNTTVPNFAGGVMTVAASNDRVTFTRRDGTQFLFIIDGRFLSRLSSVTDAHGNTITLIRNPSNLAQLTQIVDPVGRALNLTYDSSNRITSITDPIGRQVSYTYDAPGRLATYTNAEGGVTSYAYDSQHRLTSVVDPRGVTIASLVYDANGRVSQQTLADGSVMQFQYTLMNPLAPTSPVIQTQVTDGLGNQFNYRFNEFGFLVQFTDATGQTRVFDRQLPPPISFSPPPANSVRPLVTTTSATMPEVNQLLGVSGVADCSTCGDTPHGDFTFTWDANGNMLTRTDTLGNVTSWTYQALFNKPTSVRNALGQTTRFSYDNQGNLLSIVDARSNVTNFVYNALGQVTQVTDAAGAKTLFTYDVYGNLATATDPLGRVTAYRFDPISRLIETTDRLGRKNSTAYDRLNRTTSTRDAKGQTIAFAYDPVGNLLRVTDARNSVTAFTYDALSRVKTRTSPLGKTDTWTYDLDGNVTQVVDRRGQTSGFRYDALNRLTHEGYQDGSTVDRSYDARGRLTEATDTGGGRFRYTYDETGNRLSETNQHGSVTYTRDAAWRVKTRQVAGSDAVTYSYDATGNLSAANSSPASAGFTYDARNLLASQSRSNGVASNYGLLAVWCG